MKKVKLAIIGLGQRGFYQIRDSLVHFNNIEITGLCDLYQDRIDRAAELIKEKRGETPYSSTNFKDILAREDVDAVYIASAWESHIMIAIESLKAGKITACEVGGSYSIEECFELVKTQENTGTPFMFMENCCFGKNELFGTALARAGKLGTIVHCEGAYAHDLRDEIAKGNINRHYRLRNYTYRNCDNYPTHDLGPIARLLNINRGNRMVSLVSMASKACGLEEYIKEKELWKEDPTLKDRKFLQGDIVTTIIKCANGETITLSLDTTLPRCYDRKFTLRGTKGFYSMTTNSVFLDGGEEIWDPAEFTEKTLNNAKNYYDEFLPDCWAKMTEEDIKRGHGGMDYLMFDTFFNCILENKEMPIDVYDGAAWMCISSLSEMSIAEGGSVQSIPDFTNGKWLIRESFDVKDLSK